jgi:hypothetical protein
MRWLARVNFRKQNAFFADLAGEHVRLPPRPLPQ